jgi:polar amino acid transport system substrate-binding protein
MAPLDDLRLGDGVRLHAILGAQQGIEAAIKHGYPLKLLNDSPAYYEPLAIAIANNDSEFSQRISDIVKELQSDGTIQSLSMKWYGVDYSQLIK